MQIVLTPKAAERLITLLNADPFNVAVTLTVTGTGCNGYSYKLSIEKQEFLLGGYDKVEFSSYPQLHFYVDRAIMHLLENLTIDFVSEGLNQQFKFINPIETARCGCGNSFTVGS